MGIIGRKIYLGGGVARPGRWYSGDSILFHHVPRLYKQFHTGASVEMSFFSPFWRSRDRKWNLERQLNMQSLKGGRRPGEVTNFSPRIIFHAIKFRVSWLGRVLKLVNSDRKLEKKYFLCQLVALVASLCFALLLLHLPQRKHFFISTAKRCSNNSPTQRSQPIHPSNPTQPIHLLAPQSSRALKLWKYPQCDIFLKRKWYEDLKTMFPSVWQPNTQIQFGSNLKIDLMP